MGKLTIRGEAAKEYAYDLMEISVQFWGTEGSAAAAIKKVTHQSEEFLEELERAGVKPEDIHIGEDAVERRSTNSGFQIEVERKLKLCVPFNMDFANFIRNVVQKKALDAGIETHYKFSAPETIHQELLKMALEDSRQKATFIAETMGERVVGIKTMTVGDALGRNLLMCPQSALDSSGVLCFNELNSLLSHRVQAPLSMESESVEVVWLIE